MAASSLPNILLTSNSPSTTTPILPCGDCVKGMDFDDRLHHDNANYPLLLLATLQQDYSQFHFKTGKKFAFRPPKTIILGPPEPNYALLALHELGHALCGHYTYATHVQRLKIESEAWQMAKTLCAKYHIDYDDDFVEDQLDTYRIWLHQKSTCHTCGLTCYQSPDGNYHCPLCEA